MFYFYNFRFLLSVAGINIGHFRGRVASWCLFWAGVGEFVLSAFPFIALSY